MACPIKAPTVKTPMCKPPPLIQKRRGQTYQNILEAYGEPKQTENKAKKESYCPLTEKFSNLYEPFKQGLACLEGRKTALTPCGNSYLVCNKGDMIKETCKNGQFFNPATSSCTDRTRNSQC